VSGDLLEASSDVPEVISGGIHPADARLSPSGHIPLRSINAVAVHIPSIESARSKVTTEMESMVLEGLAQVASYFLCLETSVAR
jgi:conserved oligomeric Golgi complex subunit 5